MGAIMNTVAIKNKNILKIEDEENKMVFYGSDQEWYSKKWQRMAGCGPSAVANIMHYLISSNNDPQSCSKLTKTELLKLMDEIWNYVTPGLGGVNSTGKLRDGVLKYTTEKELNIRLGCFDIPKKKALRPDLQQVVCFLTEALSKDSPVAFLNLEHGTIEELESWHWVTMIALEYDTELSATFATILDCGLEKRINLAEWLDTTKLGGGFVSFEDLQ
jgi:hypothetical protein